MGRKVLCSCRKGYGYHRFYTVGFKGLCEQSCLIRSLGIEAPILGSNGFADPVTIQLAGELNDNVY